MEKASSRQNKTVQSAILDAEKSLFEKLPMNHRIADEVDRALVKYIELLFGQEDTTEQMRIKAADAATAIAVHAYQGTGIRAVLDRELVSAREQERSFSVQQSLDRTRKALER